MANAIIIAGFPSSNRVPGPYGEVLYGTSGQSAANLPLLQLCVGMQGTAAGNGLIAVDTGVQQIFSKLDADTYAFAGSEGACMLYDAIDTAGNAGVPVFYASPKPAGGATQATAVIFIGGAWTSPGSLIVRIAGKTISVTVASGDTPSTVATNITNAINGFLIGRLPVSAAASTAYVTLSCKTAGVRGMQHVAFVDTSQAPAGMTATFFTTWVTLTAYTSGATPSFVIPKTNPVSTGFYFKCTTAGTTGASEPVWPTTIGGTVADGTVTWTCWGVLPSYGANQQAAFLGNSTGTETYTNLISTLAQQQFDRIAFAANDATNLGAFKTAIDGQAAAPSNILQHVCAGSNAAYASAQSIAQTTLNDQRFQVLWCLNCETHPSRIASAMAGLRALTEQTDPDAAYNYQPLTTVAPQSQIVDTPTLAILITAINNSVTPLTTYRGEQYARVVRSITSHSLLSGNPDYSTLDTGQASVPDFILKDLKLYWSSVFGKANVRVQDNPGPLDKLPPSGVAYPALWANSVFGKLVDYSKGILSGTSPSVAPIILQPQPSDVSASFDNVSKRIMTALNVTPAYNDAQVGISVRQAA
jgi:phage tail sheath gpL-like